MANPPKEWMEGAAKTVTFSVTEDCNLRCKYCYMTDKSHGKRMDFQTAKKAVDYILSCQEFIEEAVIWEFVGGEPFLEVSLIDEISDYIKFQMYATNHRWFSNYMFSITTNGLLYRSEAVQKYIKKNLNHLSISITVDGNKTKHDLQRVKCDGSGSYDDVIKAIPLWLEQFPGRSTKATFSHDDLPFLKDSIIDIWNHGIKSVMANVVFEDVWKEGDDEIFESELRQLADYVIESGRWQTHHVKFFDYRLGFPILQEELEKNWCGVGNSMIAINHKGTFFPCVRFIDFTLPQKPAISIGNAYDGINNNKLKPFKLLTVENQSSEECINCQVASGCSFCVGCNYEASERNTIFQRAVFKCKMHKANVRAVEYYWNKWKLVTNLESPRDNYRDARKNISINKKYLIIVPNNTVTPHCNYSSSEIAGDRMDEVLYNSGLSYAEEHGFTVASLGCDMLRYNFYNARFNDSIRIINNNEELTLDETNSVVILHVNRSNIKKLYANIAKQVTVIQRLNIIIDDVDGWTNSDIADYANELDRLSDIVRLAHTEGREFQINVLSDIDSNSCDDCGAGIDSFALAPNGRFYACPAFYFDDPDNYIGDLKTGISERLCAPYREMKTLARGNNSNEFNRNCVYLNKKFTGELFLSSDIQQTIARLHKNKSIFLKESLNNERNVIC